MKFNKELEENAVPEWRVKYFNYKQGKKKLKAVGRAIRGVDRSPPKSGLQVTPSLRDGPVYSFLRGRGWLAPSSHEQDNAPMHSEFASSVWEQQNDLENASGAVPVTEQADERSPLRQRNSVGDNAKPHMRRYGSIIGSPPGSSSPVFEGLSTQRTQESLLELPEPALDPEGSGERQTKGVDPDYDRPVSPGSREQTSRPPPTQMAHTGNAYEIRRPTDAPPPASIRSGLQSALKLKRVNSAPSRRTRPSGVLQRVFSVADRPASTRESDRDNDVALEAYREFDFRKAEFFNFLDGELDKIESFYKERENEARERLEALRQQLHILRDMRVHDIEAEERRKKGNYMWNRDARHPRAEGNNESHDPDERSRSRLPGGDHLERYRHSVVAHVDNVLDKVRTGHVGKTAEAMRDLGTPLAFTGEAHTQDYTRRPQQAVNYRVGKRKLKHAFVEYYRSLELLKSYTLLNHTAFRKITKKCDKTMPGKPGMQYFRDRVNKAYFVTSDALDVLIHSAEDYYARYFERGSQYAARSYFRQPGYKSLSYDGSMLRAGLFAGFGLGFGINGLVAGIQDATSSDEELATKASYLLQLYAGFFLCLFFAFMFCFACREWKRYKVNYVLIFELNRRHNLDWRQLAEFGALFILYLGLIMSLNFDWVGSGPSMYTYWPAVMLGVSTITVFLPLPIWYHRSRLWFVQRFSRLFFSGIYPVEFSDLFIGDLFCSMTYVFGNVELFFCLYQKDWNDPPQCNSSNSILFGIFMTLPGIMRAAQCLRRYRDTGQVFPQLVNCGKYCCTIAMYALLSAFRLRRDYGLLIAFSTVATVNSIYCIIWDTMIDWSLGSTTAKWPLMRKELLFSRVWWYYAALLLDPILRFNWVLYVAFVNDVQHSSIVSFVVAFSEVFRRGFWALFRVENEQISFNRQLLASRRPSLPFSVPAAAPEQEISQIRPSPMVETLRRVGSAMTSAHEQDFVRKRVPVRTDGAVDEDDDDDDD